MPLGGTSSSEEGGCGPDRECGEEAAKLRLGSDWPSDENTGTWMLRVLGLGDLLCVDLRSPRPPPGTTPPVPAAPAWSGPSGGMPSSELSDDARSSLFSTLMPRECDTLLSEEASFISTDPLQGHETRHVPVPVLLLGQGTLGPSPRPVYYTLYLCEWLRLLPRVEPLGLRCGYRPSE